MERITISLENDLAAEFDRMTAARGYESRSEAIRDLIRGELDRERLESAKKGDQCVGTLSYIYNHHERQLGERMLDAQHEHHDLCVSTMHAHLDHDSCIEAIILKGPTRDVRQFAERILAERGIRHGNLNLVSATAPGGHGHPLNKAGKARRAVP